MEYQMKLQENPVAERQLTQNATFLCYTHRHTFCYSSNQVTKGKI